MNQTLLIDFSDFDDFVDVSDYVRGRETQSEKLKQKFEQFIFNTQISKLMPLICQGLYKELIEQKKKGTLTDENLLLLNGTNLADQYDESFFGVKGYLVFETYSTYLDQANFRSTRQGIVEENTNNTQKLEQDRLNNFRKYARQQADFHESQLMYFLEENKADYPLYDCKDCYEQKTESNQISVVKTRKDRGREGFSRIYRIGNGRNS